jgi:hypothetical protein
MVRAVTSIRRLLVEGGYAETDVPVPTHEHQEARRGHGQMKPVNREGTV